MIQHRIPILARVVAAILIILILSLDSAFARHSSDANINCIQIPVLSPQISAKASLDWSQAVRVQLRDFWSQKTHPLEPTEVLLLNTGASLRIKFLCEDRDIRSAPDRQHDGDTFRDDCVEVFFARPDPGVAEGRGLEINAAGAISDLRAWTPVRLDFSWNSGAALVENLTVNATGDNVRFTIQHVSDLLVHGGRLAVGPGWMLEIDFPWIWLRRELALPETSAPYPTKIRANFARWNYGDGGRIFTIWSDSGLSVPKPHAPSRYGWLILERRSPED